MLKFNIPPKKEVDTNDSQKTDIQVPSPEAGQKQAQPPFTFTQARKENSRDSKDQDLLHERCGDYVKIKPPTNSDNTRILTLPGTEYELLDSPAQTLRKAEIAPIGKTIKIDSTPKLKLAELSGDDALVDHKIVYDDTQIAAIEGLVGQHYGCITGAAGTGKTTVLKAVIQKLEQGVKSINMAEYFGKERDEDDPDIYIPAIAMCAFTGRASQMIKKNFPSNWHPNIMTIHRLLHFVPEHYEDLTPDGIVMKMRFVPSYDANNKLDWDIIVIDEAGMLAIDLWHQLFAALKPGTRIYKVGDINQLPPVHGNSIFGYAMAKWPSWELTHIHRQVGDDNPIVENAWRILRGERPIPHKDFTMLPLDPSPNIAGRQLQQAILALHRKGKFSEEHDVAIVATNGHEQTQRHYPLGQFPNNSALARILNNVPMDDRILIDAGRTKKEFAVGDKVMATKNDHEAGITNGMTGFIREIVRNGQYLGDPTLVGKVREVNENMAKLAPDEEDLTNAFETMLNRDTEEVSSIYRGHASHTVTIEFTALGISKGVTRKFDTFSELDSLQHAYIVTCHKSQGGEYPLVIIAIHDCVKSMMTREWLYTAVTRASKQVLLLYTEGALNKALRTQKITGATLAEKVQKFIALGRSTLIKSPNLQTPKEVGGSNGNSTGS